LALIQVAVTVEYLARVVTELFGETTDTDPETVTDT
jgi:hypothetical protein